jgi:hypothetical protein
MPRPLRQSPAGFPAISYSDFTGQSINYAEFDGSVWKIAIAYDEDNAGDTTLVFTPSGQPSITHDASGMIFSVRGLVPGP